MCVEDYFKKIRLKQDKLAYKVVRVSRNGGKAEFSAIYGQPIFTKKGNLTRRSCPGADKFEVRSSYQVFLSSAAALEFCKAMNTAPGLNAAFMIIPIVVPKGTRVWFGVIRGASSNVNGRIGAKVARGRLLRADEEMYNINSLSGVVDVADRIARGY